MNFIVTLLILIIILGLIISIHEFGHFIAAKRGNVYVDEFSLGMGPLVCQRKKKGSETKYSIRAFPIGGYVSMAEKENPNLKIKKDRILANKSFLRNFIVLINGIFFNFVLAVILFFISGLFYGRPVVEPVVNSVVEGTPAFNSGLESGDRIVKVNGTNIKTWDDFILEVSAKKQQDNYEFLILKTDGSYATYNIIPQITKKDGVETRVFGITSNPAVYYKGFKNAVRYGFEGVYENTITILKILGGLFVGDVSLDSLSGPVGVYSLIDSVKSQGFGMLLYLTAYLSINVGIINLIPIPVFDGGRILILIIEKISRKKVSDKVENILNLVGFALMILLALYVTYNDIFRLVGK